MKLHICVIKLKVFLH